MAAATTQAVGRSCMAAAGSAAALEELESLKEEARRLAAAGLARSQEMRIEIAAAAAVGSEAAAAELGEPKQKRKRLPLLPQLPLPHTCKLTPETEN